MRLQLLGALEVAGDDGEAIELGRGKVTALAAILALAANEPRSTEQLVEELWDGDAPANAAKGIQIYVSRLRKKLPRGRLSTTAGGYALRLADDELDASRFAVLARHGRSLLAASPEHAERTLDEALALWRGPALADFRFATFAQPEIARLEELRHAALADKAEAGLALGRSVELIPGLQDLVRAAPLSERPRAQLMLALYRAGRQAEALDLYQETRRVLVEELGIEPSPSLRELERAVLRQDPSLEQHRPERAADPRSPFVGRAAELQHLAAALDGAGRSSGRVFLVAGEAGIGKSRLLDEVGAAAAARGFAVVVGKCWEAGGAPAYWPWVQVLRSAVAAAGDDVPPLPAELASLLPEVGGGADDGAEGSDPERRRFRLFDAVATFLRRTARQRPLAIVLDDLHAADAPSLLLLQFLAREIAGSPILVTGAFRDTGSPPLAAAVSELAREPATRRVDLPGLRHDDVAEYVALAAPALADGDALAADLHTRTGGNPLFVAELVRLLEDGAAADLRLAIPSSVRDTIARRVERLADGCADALRAASVFGREFRADALAAVLEREPDDILTLLDEAVASQLLEDEHGSPSRFRFTHVLVRETIYDGLPASRRTDLHRRAAAALTAIHGDRPGPHTAELAHHSLSGRDALTAERHARRAGDYALTLLAFEEAARLYRTALDALALARPDEGAAECELLLAIGDAEARAGDASAAKEAFLEAARIARKLGLRQELARAAVGYGGRWMAARAGRDRQLVPLLNEGLDAVQDTDVQLESRLLARLGGALRDEPSRARRDALTARAVTRARDAGDAVALTYALDGRAGAVLGPDTVRACLALGTEICELAAAAGAADRLLQGHVWRFNAEVTLGDVDAAEDDLAAAARIAADLREPGSLWQVRSARAMLDLAAGNLASAERLAEQAVASGSAAQPEMAIPIHRLQHHMLADWRGTLASVERPLQELIGEHPARAVVRCALVHARTRGGRRRAGAAAFEALVADDVAAVPFDAEWLYSLSLLAEVAALLGDEAASDSIYAQLLPWRALNAADHPEGIRGSVERYLGMLAAALGRPDAAREHFEAALERNEQMGAVPWVAATQLDYASFLTADGRRADADAARSLLGAAAATFERVGMPAYAARAAALR